MNKQTVDIIEDFVKELVAEFVIDNVIDNSGIYTLKTKNTWWLTINNTVTIQGNNYIITDFELNKSITVRSISNNTPTVGAFAINAPTYKHGTIRMTNDEIDAVMVKTELFPLAWLYEVIKDRKDNNSLSAIDREVDLRIFFVASADSNNWLTDDHYENVINPMQQMVDLFIDKISNSRFFTDDLEYENIPLVNFSEGGTQENSVFDCNLSGIELKLFAKIRKDLSCLI